MATKKNYSCTECGAILGKWSGQCPECNKWNSISEIAAPAAPTNKRLSGYAGDVSEVIDLVDVAPEHISRTKTGSGELDRVLGGGLVVGSVVLLGGDPGIGKSTLLLQSVSAMSKSLSPLYVTGEESLQQISLRAERLGLPSNNIRLLSETCVERIINVVKKEQPKLLIIDSIQTLFSEQLQSAPGSVAQVRESTALLVRFAKQHDVAVFLIGHVTKEGTLAGPRVLEHMVDTVLYFEGDSGSRYRLIRAIKNRFGAVNEIGVFAMTELGLREVANPSALFLNRHEEVAPGSVITIIREGTRPLLIEVQALLDETNLGTPRRVALGLEQNRLAMLLAVLHRHGAVASHGQDVFINVVGGVRITETAADLALLLAVLSSLRNQVISQETVVFGEVGLAGEIRAVPGGQERLQEAAKHGFKRAIVPTSNVPKAGIKGMKIHAVKRLDEALQIVRD